MPQPLNYPEHLNIRFPAGTKRDIEAIATETGYHRVEWVRWVVLDAIGEFKLRREKSA
jgi:hypothetical protein